MEKENTQMKATDQHLLWKKKRHEKQQRKLEKKTHQTKSGRKTKTEAPKKRETEKKNSCPLENKECLAVRVSPRTEETLVGGKKRGAAGAAWPALEEEEAHQEDQCEAAKADGAQDNHRLSTGQVQEVSEAFNNAFLAPIVRLWSWRPDDAVLVDEEAVGHREGWVQTI